MDVQTGRTGIGLAAGIVAAGVFAIAVGGHLFGDKQDTQEECTRTAALNNAAKLNDGEKIELMTKAAKLGYGQKIEISRGKDGVCEFAVK